VERLGEVAPLDSRVTVEIGDRARDLEDAVVAAR
jgi:hypothetical protein